MKTYQLTTDEGRGISESDGKRYLWTGALAYPLIALASFAGFFDTGTSGKMRIHKRP